MKIAFFGTRPYDTNWFEKINENYNYEIKFLRPNLTPDTVALCDGYDAVCAFVNAIIDENVLKFMGTHNVKLLLMRCAGYNNIDLEAAKKYGITILRVPAYSPEAVAEHSMTLAMAANRKIHKAYNKTKNNDFTLVGLNGLNLYGKTAGIIGTGKIGAAMAKICRGFGMRVLANDVYENEFLKDIVEYVDRDTLLKESDLISLHCPLFESTYHMIDKESISKMKDGVIFVNTSRGGLVNTEDLIQGIRAGKFHSVGLDVFEEEEDVVFNDMSMELMKDSTVARLLQFPNVILTAHQAFLTEEALEEIAKVTLENAYSYEYNLELKNKI